MATERPRKILIITSSGGGGLLQAANAKEQAIRAKDPHVIVFQRDVMTDWIWNWFGKFCIWQWNRAQIRGNVWVQSLFGTLAPFVEYVFRPPIFFYTLHLLFKEEIDQVIDTQIMGTSAILKAIRIFNARRNKNLMLEKVLVDLPTKKATHFFHPIKLLSEKDRKYLRLITIAPMLEEGQTEEDFWKEHCNLTKDEVQYEDYYIRQSFLKYRHRERKPETMTIATSVESEEELRLVEKAVRRGSVKWKKNGNEMEFSIPSDSLVFTLLLGSQPASDATLNYVKKFVESGRKSQGKPINLFVFCSRHEPKVCDLFYRVSKYIQRAPHYPEMLTVIPMSFQKDEVIAPLFYRSNATCTRSGGQTAMELLCVSSGQIWIHSEAKKGEHSLTNEELLKGIPGWESANAAYMQHMRSAKIVTPDTCAPLIEELMSES